MKRTPSKRRDLVSFYLLITSLLGLCLVALAFLTVQGPGSEVDLPWRKPLIGSAFWLICALGIAASFHPSRCSFVFHSKTKYGRGVLEREESAGVGDETLGFTGHHPGCGRFSAHVFWIGDRAFCAGCLGLAIGAIISIFGTALYFFVELSPSISGCSSFFWAGFVGVALGLLQYNLDFGRSTLHLLLNVLFVVGAFLLLVGVDSSTRSLLAVSYLLVLDIFWIFTRIELSRRNHSMICERCNLEICPLRRGGWL